MSAVDPTTPADEPGGERTGPRTLVIIPAYNEAEALPGTLAELQGLRPELDVVVVDDGSADETADVARSLGVDVLQLPFNLGIGGALRLGFRYAVEQDYDRALQFDADGQHDPAQIPVLTAALDEGADMVVGSRFAGVGEYRVGRGRGLAMRFLRWMLRLVAGRRFSDTSSGFRGFGRPVLERFATDYPIEYMDSVEALAIACRSGFDVREVPTPMRERAAGQASNRNLRLAYHYVRLLVVLATTPRRRPVPGAAR